MTRVADAFLLGGGIGLFTLGCGAPPAPAAPVQVEVRTASPPPPSPQVEALVARVTALEARTAVLEAKAAAVAAAAVTWSCAGKCVQSFECKANGDNSIKWSTLRSSGDTPVEAHKRLTTQCEGAVYISAECMNGKIQRTEATLVNACVRN